MDFSEIIVFYDIKVRRCSHLNEYMKFYEYQRSRSFIDLGPNHSDSIFMSPHLRVGRHCFCLDRLSVCLSQNRVYSVTQKPFEIFS